MDLKDNPRLIMINLCEDAKYSATSADDNISPISFNNSVNSSSIINSSTPFNMEDICADINGYLASISPEEDTFISHLQYYMTGIAGVIVCILGCTGNGLSAAILWTKMYTSSTNVYLLALAATDSFLLVFAFLLSLSCILDADWPDSTEANHFRAYTFPYVQPLVNTFQSISIWLVLAFTVDRYIMICHPFQGTRFCNRKRAVIVVSCLYLVGFLYNIPNFFENKTVVKYQDGVKYVGVELTEFGASQFYLEFIHLWSYLIFIFVLPCLTLAVLNFQLIITVKQSKSEGRRLSLGTATKQRNDTTLMLVAVVVVFLLCQLPALISHTVWASMPNKFIMGGSRYDYLRIMLEVSNFLVILNSAINILLYYVFSPKFRKAFLAKFCKPCLRKGTLLVTKLNKQLFCQSADTSKTTKLSSTDTCHEIGKSRELRCPSASMESTSSGTTCKPSPVTRQSTVMSFSTMLTNDGVSLLSPIVAEQLSHFMCNVDIDNDSQSSASDCIVHPSDPTNV